MSALTGAGFRAFSAATQGDWDRAAGAVMDIPQEEWPGFVSAVSGLAAMADADSDRPRRHRLCDNCERADHTGCSGYPCSCTSVDCPA